MLNLFGYVSKARRHWRRVVSILAGPRTHGVPNPPRTSYALFLSGDQPSRSVLVETTSPSAVPRVSAPTHTPPRHNPGFPCNSAGALTCRLNASYRARQQAACLVYFAFPFFRCIGHFPHNTFPCEEIPTWYFPIAEHGYGAHNTRHREDPASDLAVRTVL